MGTAVADRTNSTKQADSGIGVKEAVFHRFTWAEVTPFPDNPPISNQRIARLRRDKGYVHSIIGTPELADNTAEAFPGYPPETVFVLDGNNRFRIAELEGRLDQDFLGKLWSGLTVAEMQGVCLGSNNRRTIKPAEGFKRRAAIGDTRLRAINAVVEELGWEVTYERTDGGLSCTKELEWLWGTGSQPAAGRRGALVRTIETYEQVFGHTSPSGQGNVIKGIGAFWLLYPDADIDRLVLALDGLTVKKLYDSARQRKLDLSLKYIYNGFVDVLRHRYNSRLRSGRLPERRMGREGKGWVEETND